MMITTYIIPTLLFLLVLVVNLCAGTGGDCRESERMALLDVKAELIIDDYGRLSSWGFPNCCEWKGVVCDNRTNHVVALVLHGDFYREYHHSAPVRGKISSSLLQLPHLRYLDLSFSSLHGTTIPNFIGSLSKLQHLNLSHCSFAGPIPHQIGNLSALTLLDLSFNSLNLSIPDAMGNLTSLSHLDLSWNELQGEFPLCSQNSSSLTYLDLNLNSLNGQFSNLLTWLQDPVKLEYIDLSDNQFTGSLPNISRFSTLKKMDLWNNRLNGAVLEGSVKLPNVEYLDLSLNKFTGVSPGDLWLPNLEYLDLSSNKFMGRLPNMSSCVSLRVLKLFDNTFNGSLIENIGHLPKIEVLKAAHNNFEEVITEAHLSSLPRLTDLDLSFNFNITVSISNHGKHPIQFESLNLAYCKLGPGFPEWLQNQHQLQSLDISHSEIMDIIPTWFWNNIQMCYYLNMSHNQIYGVLPDLSSKFKQFNSITIDLSSNEFTGSLPLLLQVPFTIDLSRNKFSGTIPNLKIPKMLFTSLDLSNNQLSGEIPQDCFNSGYLNLANNNLSGDILTANDFSCGVFSLHLRNNSFSGEIPISLMNCHRLSVLDLGENEFSGKIPSWLGASFPDLKVLILKSNKFSGSLPSSICNLANIQVLDISSNKIAGMIPNCVNNFSALMSLQDPLDSNIRYSHDSVDSASIIWKRNEATFLNTLGLLKMIDLSGNELVGEIPQEITSLIGLLGLNLSGNNLDGLIPQHIDQFELLNFLDMSRNNLSGGIPPTLSKLSHLGVLDLSFNNLSGRIPWETHMQTFGASAYSGNPGLCGPPLLSRPCPEDVKPSHDSEDEEDKFITRGFYISLLLGFVLAFWVCFWILFFQKWWSVFVMKAYMGVEDWLYVHILVNKRRVMRFLGKE